MHFSDSIFQPLQSLRETGEGQMSHYLTGAQWLIVPPQLQWKVRETEIFACIVLNPRVAHHIFPFYWSELVVWSRLTAGNWQIKYPKSIPFSVTPVIPFKWSDFKT